MSKGAMIAVIAGAIIVAAVAGVVASMSAPSAAQDNSTDIGTGSQGGKKITINLDENLGLKENS
ncbi:MAG: hypothetical protein ACREAY_01815 [Nitrososphaera sp.]|uniref:hypothetical protein n=1 Tax=Nitrososphaera sp. TaxID=1971748 RepID=UPI003D700285